MLNGLQLTDNHVNAAQRLINLQYPLLQGLALTTIAHEQKLPPNGLQVFLFATTTGLSYPPLAVAQVKLMYMTHFTVNNLLRFLCQFLGHLNYLAHLQSST